MSSPSASSNAEANSKSSQTSDEPDNNPLDDLIASASPAILRKLLISLCQDRENEHSTLTQFSKSRDTSASPQATKRKRAVVCAGCHQEYDEQSNKMGDCTFYKWHPETVVVNDDTDVWQDCDDYVWEHRHELFEDNPDGFIYECCDGDGTAPPCQPFRHVPVAEESNRRAKLAISDLVS